MEGRAPAVAEAPGRHDEFWNLVMSVEKWVVAVHRWVGTEMRLESGDGSGEVRWKVVMVVVEVFEVW